MTPLTKFLGRLLGLYCLIDGLYMVTRKEAAVNTITALVHSPPAVYIISAIALAAGLAMILGHNVWSGGVLPIIVTLVGWLALVKGLLLLFFSPEGVARFFDRFQYEQHFYFYAATTLILGAYLTYASFGSASLQPPPGTAGKGAD
jgi:ribose/xylose/arabinose/galactoside ABC-type transport system permease subunit